MIRLPIKPTTSQTTDSNYIYGNLILNQFKQLLFKNVNYTKIQVRYDYLISKEMLLFESDFKIDCKHLIRLLINSLEVKPYISSNGQQQMCICLFDYKLIPHSNMSYTHFLRFIQYGNEDIPPYPFFNKTWNELNEIIQRIKL